jgi:hypothetical protein
MAAVENDSTAVVYHQGAMLGAKALLIATAMVAAGAWVGKVAVYSALGVQDAAGSI